MGSVESIVGVRAPCLESPFLSVAETAIYLRLSERALENFRINGGGPRYRKHGNKVVYHIEDLIAWSIRRAYEHTGGAE